MDQSPTEERSSRGAEFGAMVYDRDDRRMLLLLPGGDNNHPVEVWSYDSAANIWTDLKPVTTPPTARDAPSVVYADDLHRLVMIGGNDNRGAVDEIWLFDPKSHKWRRQADIPWAALGRIGVGTLAAAGYDPNGRQVVLCTTTELGSGSLVFQAFSYNPSKDSWQRLNASGPTPLPMLKTASLAYDSKSKVFVLCEGVSGTDSYAPNNDVWIFAPPTPGPTSLASR